MNNSIATTNSPITTETNTMNTFDQKIHDRINLECDMVGMDVDSVLYMQLEHKLDMLYKAIEIEIQMFAADHDGDKLEYDLLNDKLTHLETSIEIEIGNQLDDERDAEEFEAWCAAQSVCGSGDVTHEELWEREAAAEEAKMARDVQEYGDSLHNMPF